MNNKEDEIVISTKTRIWLIIIFFIGFMVFVLDLVFFHAINLAADIVFILVCLIDIVCVLVDWIKEKRERK